MITSIDAKNSSDKIQLQFMIKQTRNKEELSQHYKNIYESPTANIILNGERQDVFHPLNSKDIFYYHVYSILY